MKKPKLTRKSAPGAKRSLKAIPKPSLKLRRKRNAEERVADALSNVPRITNETVAEHREDVLKSARKYIYPLQHSTHRVVRISLTLLAVAVIGFFAYVGLALYHYQATNDFIYGVTRVMPLPVAKAGPRWVSYESYLFELKRNMHYYRTQQQANFGDRDGKILLQRLKQQAMQQVLQDAYVKQLAVKNNISVSSQAVDNSVRLVRTQNRLGSNDRVFREVLSQFWGWDESDFKRELKGQLLQQAVVANLDTATTARATAAEQQIKNGTDFAVVATANSDDTTTAPAGGAYPQPITQTNRDVAPQVTEQLFNLKAGQISDVFSTGYTLEIVKVIDKTGKSLHGAHIQFNLKPIETYLKPLQKSEPAHRYIKF